MNNTLEEAIQKTVKFWVEKSFKTALNQNNGDNSESGAMAFLLMNMVGGNAQESITDDKIKMFEENLTASLMSCSSYDRTLNVDYHPCKILADAAKYADIDPGCFPCKTFTSIKEGNTVTASFQYGGEIVTL